MKYLLPLLLLCGVAQAEPLRVVPFGGGWTPLVAPEMARACVNRTDAATCGALKRVEIGQFQHCPYQLPRLAGWAAEQPVECEFYAVGSEPGVTPPVVTPPVVVPPAVTVPACYPGDDNARDLMRVYMRMDGSEINELLFDATLAVAPKSVAVGQRWRCSTTGTQVHGNVSRGDEVLAFLADVVKWWLDPSTTKAQRDDLYKKHVDVACIPGGECADFTNNIATLGAKWNAAYPPTPGPVVVRYWVQPTSPTVLGDRPVYRIKADGTRNTTAVSGKRAVGKTLCGTKRIGTTAYYDVPILKDMTGDLYAVCVLAP